MNVCEVVMAVGTALQGSLKVPRPLCPATLAPLAAGMGVWRCGACLRQYASGPGSAGGVAVGVGPPQCVTCGVRLSRPAIPSVLPDVGL